MCDEEYGDDNADDFLDDDTDDDYDPWKDSLDSSSSTTSMSGDEDDSTECHSGPTVDPKYIVFDGALRQLFKVCHELGCGSPIIKLTTRTKGFSVTAFTECMQGHRFTWESSPKIGKLHASNLLVPCSILLTGNSFSTFHEMASAINLKTLSVLQMNNIQRAYIVPEIERMWDTHITALMSEALNIKHVVEKL